jgi:prepilin peptidase CpaA
MSAPLSCIALALLLVAAWHDIVTRTIPDSIGLVLVAAGVIARILEGPAALAVSAATALVLFVLLLVVFSRGLIGGGDVKIMTALAVGLSPLDSYRFAVATAIAGGILAIVYLLLSRAPHAPSKSKRNSLLSRIIAVESLRIHRRGSLPYGVAIAGGGAFVLLHTGSF